MVLMDNIDGSILKIDYELNRVLCELYTSPNHRSVNIPLKHFHHSILRVGCPINFKIDLKNNSLIITQRELKRDPNDDLFWDSIKF